MNVWIVNPFDNLPIEGCRPQRYWLMAQAFVRAGHRVTLWTSDFSHATKSKRVLRQEAAPDDGVEVIQIPTRPYSTNVCWARVRSHRRLAEDFERLARSASPRPDLVVASTPPLGLCDAAMRTARNADAVFVCDIQDAWPETFERVLPRFVWSALGMRKTAKRLYCGADGVSAVATRYVELARKRGASAPIRVFGHCMAMGIPAHADAGCEMDGNGKLRLAYIGNMSFSYDLETVMAAVAEMPEVTLAIAGNGPDRKRLEDMAARWRQSIRFLGYLGEEDLSALLRSCDVGVVPMFPESCVGVPGKLADYAAAGLRVIESLGGECRDIVERHGAGTHYVAGNVASFKEAVAGIRRLPASAFDGSGFAAAFDAASIMGDYVRWCETLAKRKAGGKIHI